MKVKKRLLLAATLLLLCPRVYTQVKTLSGKSLSEKDIDAFIQGQMDSLKIPALSIAIVQDGKIVYYKAKGIKNEKQEPIDSTTIFEAASMTKPVFAYAVHQLAKRQTMSLDTALYHYYAYDDLDHDDRYKSITAKMVLSHTTGLPNWRGTGGNELNFMFDPGIKYSYSGEGFEYLALVVKHLLNKKVEDVVEQEVFRSLRMHAYLVKNQYVIDHLADGLKNNKEWGSNGVWKRPHVAYSLCTEAKEYSKFLIQIMKESRASSTVFQQMAAPQMEVEANKWICLGIFMEETPYGPKYSHSGNNNNRYNSNFEFYRDHDLGYVFFMNCHQEPEFTKRLNDFLTDK